MLDTLSLIGDRIIAYRPILRTLGISSTTNGTLLASQLLYLYQQAGRQPFAVTDPELSAQIGLSVDEIRKARADLVKRLGDASFFRYEVRGWERQGFYDVDADRINAITHKPSQDSHSVNQPNGKPQSGSPFGQSTESIRSSDRVHSVNGPKASGQSTESSIYKNLLEEIKPEEEPPLSPAEPAKAAKAKKPKTLFTPTEDDIPPALLPVAIDLLDFWESKGGRKTLLAWGRLLKELDKIQGDAAGGTEVVRVQLQTGIQTGWQCVTHANWHKFGRQGQGALPFGNGSSRRTSTSITHDSRIEAGDLLRSHGLI